MLCPTRGCRSLVDLREVLDQRLAELRAEAQEVPEGVRRAMASDGERLWGQEGVITCIELDVFRMFFCGMNQLLRLLGHSASIEHPCLVP